MTASPLYIDNATLIDGNGGDPRPAVSGLHS